MDERVWAKRNDGYSIIHDEWTEKYTGVLTLPSGKTRECNHKHASEDRAIQCAWAIMGRAWKESR